MQSVLRSPNDLGRLLPAWLLTTALIFWGFTYSLFSFRAQLRYGLQAQWGDVERFIVTAIGAAFYAGVVVCLQRCERLSPQIRALAILSLLPASALLFLIRTGFDGFALSTANLAQNFRWVSVWSGYFGLWVSATVAMLPVAARIEAAACAGQPLGYPMADPLAEHIGRNG